MRHMATWSSVVAAVLIAAGTVLPSVAHGQQPKPRGEIVFYVNDFAYRAASFDDTEVAVGKMGGPSYSERLRRTGREATRRGSRSRGGSWATPGTRVRASR
jgi:hypothetical protein